LLKFIYRMPDSSEGRFHAASARGERLLFTKFVAILYRFFTLCEYFLHSQPEITAILQFGKDLVTHI